MTDFWITIFAIIAILSEMMWFACICWFIYDRTESIGATVAAMLLFICIATITFNMLRTM